MLLRSCALLLLLAAHLGAGLDAPGADRLVAGGLPSTTHPQGGGPQGGTTGPAASASAAADARSFEERAAALVEQMTLSEKIAQLNTDTPAIERLNVTHWSWWQECLHGLQDRREFHKGGTFFPQVPVQPSPSQCAAACSDAVALAGPGCLRMHVQVLNHAPLLACTGLQFLLCPPLLTFGHPVPYPTHSLPRPALRHCLRRSRWAWAPPLTPTWCTAWPLPSPTSCAPRTMSSLCRAGITCECHAHPPLGRGAQGGGLEDLDGVQP